MDDASSNLTPDMADELIALGLNADLIAGNDCLIKFLKHPQVVRTPDDNMLDILRERA